MFSIFSPFCTKLAVSLLNKFVVDIQRSTSPGVKLAIIAVVNSVLLDFHCLPQFLLVFCHVPLSISLGVCLTATSGHIFVLHVIDQSDILVFYSLNTNLISYDKSDLGC